jgi:hypothetical protein
VKRTPLTRRTPLKAKTGLKQGGGLKRTAMKRKNTGPDPAWQAVRDEVAARAGTWCEVRWDERCVRYGSHAHHKLRRSQGGPDTPENLVWACHVCHELIHRNPAEAKARGWLRSPGVRMTGDALED